MIEDPDRRPAGEHDHRRHPHDHACRVAHRHRFAQEPVHPALDHVWPRHQPTVLGHGRGGITHAG